MSASTDEDDYVLSRGYRASARLYVQHWLWGCTLGYLLHPSIPITDSIKIADVGTGPASWLLELSQQVAPSVQLDGFDISPAMFPQKAWLPVNMSLGTFDAIADVPERLVGRYDVVHIRCFVCIVKNNDPSRLLANLIRMLKPGGYLQWDEVGSSTMSASDASVLSTASEELMARFFAFRAKNGWLWDWTRELGTFFSRQGLSMVDSTAVPVPAAFRKVATDNGMMGLEEMAPASSTMGLGRSEYYDLIRKVTVEIEAGVAMHYEMIVWVGRKGTASVKDQNIKRRTSSVTIEDGRSGPSNGAQDRLSNKSRGNLSIVESDAPRLWILPGIPQVSVEKRTHNSMTGFSRKHQPNHNLSHPATPSIHFICLAVTIAQALALRFHYAVLLDSSEDLASSITILLDSLNPTPRGVIMGGEFDGEVMKEVERVVKGLREGRKGGEEAEEVKVLGVPKRSLGGKEGGRVGEMGYLRAELGRVYWGGSLSDQNMFVRMLS